MSALEIVNLRDATRCTDETFTPIDHCFISKDQIIDYNVTTTTFNSDHFLIIFVSNLSLKSESDKIITMRNLWFSSRSKFNTDFALAKWWRLYQCENGNDMFDSFIDIFEKSVEKHATIQTVKQGQKFFRILSYGYQKTWSISYPKYIFFSINGKKIRTARRTKNLSV